MSLNNIYLLTSHIQRQSWRYRWEESRIRSLKWMTIIHYSTAVSHGPYTTWAVCCGATLGHISFQTYRQTTKTQRAANSFKTPDQRQVWLKENKKGLDSEKWSSLTIYTANNTEMVNVDGSQHRAGWDHRKHCQGSGVAAFPSRSQR